MKSTNAISANSLSNLHALCILAVLVLTLVPAHASQVTSGIFFAQVSFTSPDASEKYSHYGQISVDFTMLPGEGYLNVERYYNGKAAGWVVKNLPVVSGSVLSGFSTMFDLGASGYQSSISAYADFSVAPLADDSSLKNQVALNYQLAQAEYLVPAADSDKWDVYFEAVKECPKGIDVQRLGDTGRAYGPFKLNKGKKDVCFQNRTDKVLRAALVTPDKSPSDSPSLKAGPFFTATHWSPKEKGSEIYQAMFEDLSPKKDKGIPKDQWFVLHVNNFEPATQFTFGVFENPANGN